MKENRRNGVLIKPLGVPAWECFDKNLSDSECWNWPYTKFKDGYGQIRINKKIHLVHRVVYEHYFGEIPDGLIVCHRCDNPSCGNPNHLFLGTYEDNNKDRHNKNRDSHHVQNRAENCGTSVLTWEKVREIRSLQGEKGGNEVAEMFGVARSTVYSIWRKYTWRYDPLLVGEDFDIEYGRGRRPSFKSKCLKECPDIVFEKESRSESFVWNIYRDGVLIGSSTKQETAWKKAYDAIFPTEV